MQHTAPILKRPGKLMLVIPEGSSVVTFGDALVVVHELHPPAVYDRHTGDRLQIDGFLGLRNLQRDPPPARLELVPQVDAPFSGRLS